MRKIRTNMKSVAAIAALALLLAAAGAIALPAGAAAAAGDQYPTWYLAEGSTAWGFATWITIENPNDSQVTARVTYMPTGAPNAQRDVTLAPMSHTTLWSSVISQDIGAKDFSTKVECLQGKTICVDRTMYWTGQGAKSEEGHSSVGVTAPQTTWYFPEGSSNWGFECWILVQNPQDTVATCQFTYMVEGVGPVPRNHEVQPHSRASFSMKDDVGVCDASIKVDSNVPVIPERAMYRYNRREGHESIGTTSVWKQSYLAEGTTAWGFTTFVLIQNPNGFSNRITVVYMTPSGPRPQPQFVMAPFSRKTIRVNDVLPSTDFSTTVAGADGSVIAERAMYWGEGSALGEACHDSIGLTEPHTTFYLPDGWTGYTPVQEKTYQTYTLVQNPNVVAVEVRITYLTYDGKENKVITDTIAPSSRKTYDMAGALKDTKAAIVVECLTEGSKILAERSMYWNNRGAGTDTIGGFSD